MPSWIIPLLPLVGVVVGYVLNFFTNSHANKQQLKRDQIAYKHSVQDVRRERLRSAYKVILNAAEEYQSVLLELQVVYAGETEDTRNKRLSTSLNQNGLIFFGSIKYHLVRDRKSTRLNSSHQII